jgi:phenylacetate-CoA ligase
MPFIRYEMGDIVVASEQKCSCGRSFPVIQSISGRKADTIKTPSGREFGAAILTHLLYGTDHILESQIIQDRIDHLFIDYVPGENFSAENLRSFERLIQYHLPGELRVDFRVVGAVSKTASGKIKPVISLLS